MTGLFSRLVSLTLLLLGVSIFTFLLLHLAPGDYWSADQFGSNLPQQTIEAHRARHDVNQPLPTRFLSWLRGLLRGDWGVSYSYGLPVLPLLQQRAQSTLLLATATSLLAWAFALLFAALSSQRPTSALTRSLAACSNTLLSLPDIVVALAVLLLFIRIGTPDVPAWVAAGLALFLTTFPFLWKQAHAHFLHADSLPFVEAARDNGLPRTVIVRRYLFPAAAPPLVSLAGVSIGSLLSSSLLVECVSGFPGLGPLVLEAVFARDTHLVAGAILLSASLWALGGFASDLLQRAIDPRTRSLA